MYHEFRRWAKVTGRGPSGYRRAEVTLETDRVLIVRKTRIRRGWCEACGREVDLIRQEDAVVIAGMALPPPPAADWDKGWHWVEIAEGTLLVCLPSVVSGDQGMCGSKTKFHKLDGAL